MDTYTIDIRPRRQTTLPKKLLEELGLEVGDKLVASVKNKTIILKSNKQVFTDAFDEIQRIVKESGITEEEIQKSLRETRQEIYDKRYRSKGIS
ncbi:hypothetical protein A2W14_06300 [Candidatus Gottesmanbacteria bacterium RBG_16_37_8]|uniref:SpoVT-AbrB domain-containing protein n=1 Tax=Candidatus Gottesmanbacteria bacterium RBG_16_37_8 TaxID=1798371 RepID=A0A1F5YWJ0_9BACT|nr:MAG: hypothetical protein A2W14_06300 [Candidatus Gottesmanbacteria bacterium RBG_16_37_8]